MSTRRSRPPIWTQPAPGSRRPRFTRDQIAEVGLRIADTDGFEALSMRRIADELGAGTMTLYHYIRTKDDLLALLDDAIMGEVLVPEGEFPNHWRTALAVIARRSRAAFARHPWAQQALQAARFGPNGVRHFEQSMAAAALTRLPLADQMLLLHVVDDYVFGYTVRSSDDRVRRNQTERELRSVMEFTTALIATGDFPHMAAMVGGGEPMTAWRRVTKIMAEDRFEQGLAIVLDGIALRWKLPAEDTAAPPPKPPAPHPRLRARSARTLRPRGRRRLGS